MHHCIDKILLDFISSEHMKNQPERYGKSFLIAASLVNKLEGVRVYASSDMAMVAWENLLPQVRERIRAWDRVSHVNRSLVENYARLMYLEYNRACDPYYALFDVLDDKCHDETVGYLPTVLQNDTVWRDYINMGKLSLIHESAMDNIRVLRNDPKLNDRSKFSPSEYGAIINEVSTIVMKYLILRITRLRNVSELYNLGTIKDMVRYLSNVANIECVTADGLARSLNIAKEWMAYRNYCTYIVSNIKEHGSIADAVG